MSRNFDSPGYSRIFLAGANYAAGDGVVLRSGATGEFGVVIDDVLSAGKGLAAVAGVHVLPAAAGAINAHALVYWSAANKNITTVASGNTLAGVAVAAKTTAGTTVSVLINGRPGPDLQ